MGWQTPVLPQQQDLTEHLKYFIGLGIGFLPFVSALVSITSFLYHSNNVGYFLSLLAITLYLIEIGGTIVCLSIEDLRSVGLGLLTMVFSSPAIILIIVCLFAGNLSLH